MGRRHRGDQPLVWVSAAFTKLDMAVLGAVRLGDNSVEQIESRGTFMFVCKNCESRSLEGVYFIPRLATNIMNIYQLDEVGCKIDTSVMKIWEPRGLLLARVKHEVNPLYLLQIKLV
jgi:hypothetical protein